MDVGLRLLLVEPLLRKFNVSILVLVDVGLRLFIAIVYMIARASFNPCFSGCWSSTLCGRKPFNNEVFVSILVLVDVGLRQQT